MNRVGAPLLLVFFLGFFFYLFFSPYCEARPVRIGMMDCPVDYDHPVIAPFIDWKNIASGEPNRNNERLSFYLSQTPDEAFRELKQIENLILNGTAFQKIRQKFPYFINAIHGTGTTSVLLDSLKPEDIIFNHFLVDDGNFLFSKLKNWIEQNKIEIVVMPFDISADSYESAKEYQNEFQSFIDLFPETLFVVAAGNTLDEVGIFPTLAKLKGSNIIKVGATDFEGNIAYFSTRSNSMIDLGAPGIALPVALPRDRMSKMSGTSISAPLVARTAARIKISNPNLSPAEILEYIKKKEAVQMPQLRFAVKDGVFLLPQYHRASTQYEAADYEPTLCRRLLQNLQPPFISSFAPDFRYRKYFGR